jgi:hypothetical protein
MNFHQIVFRMLAWRLRNRADARAIANPLATLVIAPFFVAPSVAGIILRESRVGSFAAVLIFTALYVASYAYLRRSEQTQNRHMLQEIASASHLPPFEDVKK